jgi:predicted DNA-binding transcriptional regulator AlpA
LITSVSWLHEAELERKETTMDECMTLQEVARLARISPRQVQNLVKKMVMPAPIRLGHRLLRWHPAAIERWLRGEWTPAGPFDGGAHEPKRSSNDVGAVEGIAPTTTRRSKAFLEKVQPKVSATARASHRKGNRTGRRRGN